MFNLKKFKENKKKEIKKKKVKVPLPPKEIKEKKEIKKEEQKSKEMEELDVPPEKPKSFLEKWKEKRDIKALKQLGEEEKETTEEAPETEETPKKGLLGQVQELNEKIDIISDKKKQGKKLKKKKFKIPFRVKSQLKKLAVKNKVQVMLLQRTRNIKPVIGEIRDGMLMIKDMVYNGSVASTWLWNGKIPTMIVPEWDLQPLTPQGIEEMKETSTMSAQDLMNYCTKFGRSAVPGKIIIRAIEAKQNQMLSGGKASVKTIIFVIIGTIVVMAVLFGGGMI